MFGANRILKPVKGTGDVLEVQEIFPTIQGEGPNTGVPAIFIRLGGCNLACKFCDTEFDSFAPMCLEEVLGRTEILSNKVTPLPPGEGGFSEAKLRRAGEGLKNIYREPSPGANAPPSPGGRGLIVITGGEPLRQPIERLCQELVDKGFKVQIETNGTLYRDLPKEVEIVCSPKNTGTGYHRIREDLLPRISALKFIISANDPLYLDVAEVGQGDHNIPVYVQPMDEIDKTKNRQNFARAIELSQQRGYRLSIQVHKVLGLP